MIGIALCFLPLIIAIVIFSFGFKLKITHELLACLLGLVAVIPVSLIQYFIPEIPGLQNTPLINTLLKSFILYGLVEEAFKMALIFPLPSKKATLMDFLLLSFVLGLSLGCFESVVYYFDHLQVAHNKGAQLLYSQIALRIFTSDLIHMTCAGLSGLFVYSIKQHDTRISFFLLSVFLHGIYDFFACFPNNLKWFSIIVILLAVAECRIKYNSLQNPDK